MKTISETYDPRIQALDEDYAKQKEMLKKRYESFVKRKFY